MTKTFFTVNQSITMTKNNIIQYCNNLNMVVNTMQITDGKVEQWINYVKFILVKTHD